MFRYAIFLGVSSQYVCLRRLRMSNTITYFVWIAFYLLVMHRNDVVCQLISNCAAYNIIIIVFQIFYILCRVIVIANKTRCFQNYNYSVGSIYYLLCCARIHALMHARMHTLTLYTGTWLILGMILRPIRFGLFLIICIWKLCKSVMFRRPLKWCVCVVVRDVVYFNCFRGTTI